MTRYQIGSLRQRLLLEQPIRSAGEGGAAHVIWQPVATLWAEIRPLTGKEIFRADAFYGVSVYEIRTRFREDIGPEMRFVSGQRIFDIRAVHNKDGKRRFLTCICEEQDR